MFSFSKTLETPRSSKLNEKGDPPDGLTTGFVKPRVTSTPFGRDNILISPPKPRIYSPHRYSLSEIATPPRNDRNRSLSFNSTPGPLLSSTKFSVNVSTYEDAKSPGLVSRIVQYHEQTEQEKEYKRPSTHQEKYGTVGLFPIVHLFKKDLPTLEPRKVTVKLASSDYARNHSQEYNQKLLESIIKPGSPSIGRKTVIQGPTDGTTSTRSVLDALKEISRKRIHSSEEYDSGEDDSKRIRTEQLNGDSNKRGRADSPLLDSSPESNSGSGKPQSKRICVYDEYAASCSSSNYLTKIPDNSGKRKSVSISTLTENPKDSKQVKLVTVETQTSIREPKKVAEITSTTDLERREKEITPHESKASKKRESPVKIFDDAPLERIRRNRLMALMGSLVGKDPPLTPKPDAASVLVEKPKESTDETDSAKDKPLVSIMTHNKSVFDKSDKHVHFDIPESTAKASEPTGLSVQTSTTNEPLIKTKLQTPAPPSSPVNLPSTTESNISVPESSSVVSKESTVNLSAAGDSLKSSVSLPTFQFNLPNSFTSTTLGVIPPLSSSTTSVAATLPAATVPFTPPKEINVSKSSSNEKVGGFKFDLPTASVLPSTASSCSVMSTTSTSAVNISFGVSTSKCNVSTSKSAFIAIVTTSSTAIPPSNGFTLGSKSTATVTTPSFVVNTTLPTFGGATTGKSSNVSFGTKNPTTSATLPVFGGVIGSIAATSTTASPGFGTSITSTSSTGPSGFGASNITGATFKFGDLGKETSATTLPTFGAPTTSVSFGNVPATTASAFGAAVTSSTLSNTFSFGPATVANNVLATSTASSNKPVFSFGSTNTNVGNQTTTSSPVSFHFSTSTTAAPTSAGFGAVTTSAGFGGTIGTSSVFGSATTTSSTTTPGFGVATTSITFSGGFSTPTTASASQSGFGTTTATSTPLFGATTAASSTFNSSTATVLPFSKPTVPSLGQSTNQVGFQGVTTVTFGTSNSFSTTNAGSIFGSSNSTGATAISNGFGNQNQTQNIFGGATVTQPSGFGAPSTNQTFGSTSATPFGSGATTTSSGFGNAGASSVFSFGAKTTTTASSFGSGSSFGTTTAANSGFGTTSTQSFGNANGFGAASPNFGNTTTFGTNPTPNFGMATTTQGSSFGTTNTPTFGVNAGGFGPAGNKPAFGSTAPGSSNTPAFGATAPTAGFGQPSNLPTAAPFGASGNTAAPSSAAFGSSSFGSASQAPTTTAQSGVFTFGAGAASPPSGAGTGTTVAAKPFNFGAGSAVASGSSGSGDVTKPTFNFAGSVAPPTFGASPQVSFGANTAAVPQFGTNTAAVPQFGATGPPQFGSTSAAPGTFNIGAGPPSNRGRTTLKPRRRI